MHRIFQLRRWPDCDVLGLVASWLSTPGCSGPQVYVDVGANIGACAILAASRGWRVTAIEPVAAHVALLQASAALSEVQVNVLHAAATDVPGDLEVLAVGARNSAASAVVETGAAAKWKGMVNSEFADWTLGNVETQSEMVCWLLSLEFRCEL